MPQETDVPQKKKTDPKRVMITGASGAIGAHIMAHILEHTDWRIVAIDSFHPLHKGYFDRIAEICKEHPEWKERISIFQHDLVAPFSPREVSQIGEINYIINLASRSDVPNSLEATINEPTGASSQFVRNNVELMLTMLDYARIAMPEVFLHFSTDEVYGPAPKDGGGHKEWDPHVPSNPYSASKAMQEDLAIAWWRCYNVPVIITNTMNNFGPMQAPSKFPAMIQTKIEKDEVIDVHAATDGQIGTRYYIDSRNVAHAILFILENVRPLLHGPGEIDMPERFNIVGDKQLDNQQLVEVISEFMQKPAQVRLVRYHEKNPGHDLHYGLNGEKLANIGWKSPQTFEESMKSTIEWQKAHPEWMK